MSLTLADTSSAESLFTSLLLPLYPAETRADLTLARSIDANPGKNPSILMQLASTAEVFSRLAHDAFGEDLGLDFSDASVHRLAHAITAERRDAWISKEGSEGVPLLVPLLIHGVAYLGECIIRNHAGIWKIRNPLWESLVSIKTAAGEGDLALLSWWLRALSDNEVGRGLLAERYRMHVEEPSEEPLNLPKIAPPDRKIPRMKRPHFDTLHRHLKAHLPELRDFGADFPSPERFDDFAFEWLDFVWLGEGRMLLMHGSTSNGAHLFWLDHQGFRKAMFLQVDSFPDHRIQVKDGKIRIIAALNKKIIAHEVLWWGP